MTKNAVLLLAHGSPENVADIPEYMKYVTGGRGLPESVVKEVQHRYGLIGISPLRCHTVGQQTGVQRETGVSTYIGMRNWHPFVADTIEQMKQDGIEHCVALCLAPQNSRTSVGLYRKALMEKNPPFTVDFVESWHDHPLLIQAFAENHRAGYEKARAEASHDLPRIFTAHSVPERTITEGDPYEAQTRETAALVAKGLGLKDAVWRFAFQSQGMSGGTWRGPTVESTLEGLAKEGHRGVFFQPIGFVCDHVEVLYDIDIGFRDFAEKLGMKIWRAESLNNSATFAQAIADIVRQRLAAQAVTV
ncbi:ferrochelatase [Candidatus Koribacter versatilis Ellin345]|uniref:Ferrochelatase n=1 Tax=Koribacter versatilis (strain Ellin345) TaxID=204669 RepID=Q1ITV1_KORVE|nr:ferrochelatase [Candidatus Koribacter versatilis]ABF39699.1 ferrochelatase [Candidatus Koribacter versatilis Ellin345]